MVQTKPDAAPKLSWDGSAMPAANSIPPRAHLPGQRSQVWIADVARGRTELVLESRDVLIEAPNWTLDGASLVVNGGGALWTIPLAEPALRRVDLVGVPNLNNDHVLAPDGRGVFVSANDWHIYEASLDGGPVRGITQALGDDGLMHFLHGVSPDGTCLAFVGLEPRSDAAWRANLYTVGVDGSDLRALTDTDSPADGCEFSPDGLWVYFNTEQFTGHAQLARVPADSAVPVPLRDPSGGVRGGASAAGSARADSPELAPAPASTAVPERLRASEDVEWFPHLSPDGHRAAFVAFPPGTQGHPADLWVDLYVVDTANWQDATRVARLFGGQGTLNVNSWAPDGDRFAYVAYPLEP